MVKEIAGQKIYTLEELSGQLGIPVTTLRFYAREGRIKSRKIGRAWHVTEDALKEFLKDSVSVEEASYDLFEKDETTYDMVEHFHGPRSLISSPERADSFKSHQNAIGLSSGSKMLCKIDGVEVSLVRKDKVLYLQLLSERAEYIRRLTQSGSIWLKISKGKKVDLIASQTRKILVNQGDRWLYQIELEEENNMGADASLMICGRLIPRFRD